MKLPAEIWSRIAENDKVAYEEAYIHFFRRFFNYGKKITENEQLIEDAAQEALLALWRKRHEIPNLRHPQTYFYSSFRYLLFDKLKALNKAATIVEDVHNYEETIEEKMVKKITEDESRSRLLVALQSLTDRQREAIFLRFYEELPFDQVATVMKITPKATYKIVSRALDKLRTFLKLIVPSPFLFGVVHHHF